MQQLWRVLLAVTALACCLEGLRIPSDMWEPGKFPANVPRLNSKQAVRAVSLEQLGKPPVMRDLTHQPGGLDMSDELEIPSTMRLAKRAAIADEDENEWDEPEMDEADRTIDQVIKEVDWNPGEARLLTATYGYSAGYPVSGIAVPLIQTHAYVPVVVPIVQHQPVVQVPQTVALLQPQQTIGLGQQQQTTVIGATQQQLLQPQPQQPQPGTSQQISPNGIQQNGAQQGRMGLPEVPAVQPQQQVQPDLGTTGQGRMGLPDGSGSTGQQTAQAQPQQQSVQPTITVRHQTAPQQIHIILPKSKQYKRTRYYGYY